MTTVVRSYEIPIDVKLVNGLTKVLIGLFVFLIVLSGFQYAIQNEIKSLDAVIITGNTDHSDASSVRGIFSNKMSGSFYNFDLINVKKIFESKPWISRAVVRRVYPGLVVVSLSEYKPKAIWGSREDMKLVDEAGVIFDAVAVEDEYESLPQLIGPEAQGKLMFEMYKNISSAFIPFKKDVRNLELSARGSWIATLDGGAQIELGRGNTIDVIDRVTKFSTSAEKILQKLNKKISDLQYVDLRHSDGYALRMHGVSTLDLTMAASSLKK